MSFPELAKSESLYLIQTYKRIVDRYEKPWHFKLLVSLILTTTALLLGDLFQFLSQFNPFSEFLFNKDLIFSFEYASLIIIPATFKVLLLRDLLIITKNKRGILKQTSRAFFKYLLLTLTIPSIQLVLAYLGYFNSAYSKEFSFLIIAISKLTLTIAAFIVEYRTRNKSYYYLTQSITLVTLMFISPDLVTGFANSGNLSYDMIQVNLDFQSIKRSVFYYGVNGLFDSLTVSITLAFLLGMSKSNSFLNVFLIVTDLFIALVLAYAVLFTIYIYILGFDSEYNLLDLIMSTNSHGLLIFASTTLIPSLIYASILLTVYFGRLSYTTVMKSARIIFYDSKEKIQKSPIHIALWAVAVFMSIIPGVIAYIAAYKALS